MENPTLHTQKVAILSRLVKESSLTLEEALLLLEEESVQKSVHTSWTPSTTTPYIQPYFGGSVPLTGTITVPNNFGSTSMTGFSTISSTSNHKVDLNN
jgi:hypothetical protein